MRSISTAKSPLTRAPAWILTAILGAAYLLWAPPSADMAAASYRGWLFAREGLTLWDGGWFAGHHLPAYSLLSPALSAPLGPRLPQALAATLAAALFAILVRPARQRAGGGPLAAGGGRLSPSLPGAFATTRAHLDPGRGTRLAALWFALTVGLQLLSGRVPFDLGLPFGLAALLALRARRPLLGALAAVLCALASPVDGAFLALCLLAWGALSPDRRAGALGMLVAALAPIGLLYLAFPAAGSEPFAPSSFWPALAATLALAVLLGSASAAAAGGEAKAHLLRFAALLYALALAAAFLIPSAMGGNAVRLGTLLAGPLAALQLAPGRPKLLIALAPLLLYWQLTAPVNDLAAALGNPAVKSSYYAPLLARLRDLDPAGRPLRVEVVPTSQHWEARWVAAGFPIARGWERQLDRAENPLFYRSRPLSPGRYAAWLHRLGVSYVALPAADLDYSGRLEAELLRGAPGAWAPFLREVWRSPDWRLFAVRHPAPLAQAPARMTALHRQSFAVSAPRAGSYLVRVRYTPYWALAAGSGCVGPGPGGMTELRLTRPGRARVRIDFAPDRIRATSPRCRGT